MENEVVKTYFNGAITQQQLIGIIIAVVAVIVILALAKKAIKLILTVVVIIGALIYFNVMSPEQLKDVSKVIAEKGQSTFTQISEASQNVKVDTSGETPSISVNLEGTWVNVNDITNFVKTKDGVYSVNVNGQSYSVSDDSIKKVLDLLQK